MGGSLLDDPVDVRLRHLAQGNAPPVFCGSFVGEDGRRTMMILPVGEKIIRDAEPLYNAAGAAAGARTLGNQYA